MSMIVIMPGGFHPFHAGHFALYQSAKKAFPGADLYVAATNDMSERPFPFALKEKLAKLAGVEPGHFVQVKSPFMAKEITQNYDPNKDVLVFVRSEKDRNEQPKPGGTKKDGTPAYFQPWTGKNLQPFSQHAYMAYLPTVEFGPGITSATQIRKAWPTLNDKRKTALVMSLYPAAQKNPKLAQNVVGMFDQVMGVQMNELDQKKSWQDYGMPEKEEQRPLEKRYQDWAEYEKKEKKKEQPQPIGEEESKAIAHTVKSLQNPPKIMKHRAQRDQEREHQLKYRDIAKRTDEDKDGMFISGDPESDQLLRFAQQHYPTSQSRQQAFVKFVQRALKHSEEEDVQQDREIEQIKSELNKIQQDHEKIMKVSESQDYLEEK